MTNGTAAADTVREAGALEQLGQRVEEHCQELDHTAERLARLSDRIQGSIPRDAPLKSTSLVDKEVPAGGMSAVHGLIDRMMAISQRIKETLGRLEEL